MPERLSAFDVRVAAMLLALGLVVMTSASMEVAMRDHGNALFYFWRQLMHLFIGGALMMVLAQMPLEWLRRGAMYGGIASLIVLALLLIPSLGISHTVNGSTRWLVLGPVQFQPSELAKPALILWLAAYMTSGPDAMQMSSRRTCKALGVLVLVAMLLLLEPDFGTACVVAATAIAMLFLCGGAWRVLLASALAGVLAMGSLALAVPYRWMRLQSFLDPWADPYGNGYQLTQSLIAVGSGGLWGQGLGDGVQKHFYLPEVHTDFVFAVAAEELGTLGAVAIIVLFALFVLSAFRIARRAYEGQQYFGAALAYGIGLWIGLQAFINIAVNLGALPTKGLTLPFMSAGGSSLVATMAGLGLLWRVRHEAAFPTQRSRARSSRKRA